MMKHIRIRVPLLLQTRLSGHGAQTASHGTVIKTGLKLELILEFIDLVCYSSCLKVTN